MYVRSYTSSNIIYELTGQALYLWGTLDTTGCEDENFTINDDSVVSL